MIPEGVEIKWGEPAILGQILKNTPLFLTAPTLEKHHYDVDALVKPTKSSSSFFSSFTSFKSKAQASPKFTSSAVKPFERKREGQNRAVPCRPKAGVEASTLLVHPDCVALEPGTQVFVRYHREFDGRINPHVYEVSLVAQPKAKPGAERTDMPELNRDLKSSGVHGYIFKEDITSSINAEEFMIKMEGDIFAEQGSKEDVRQAVFGNCFFLAAVAAILSKPNGYAYFQSIIKQEDEYTSVVKLYDFRENKEVYIRVQNTIFCENSAETLQHKQNWIHILEKAYVGLGIIKLNKTDIIQAYPSYREIYGKGGEIADAYRALIGQMPEEIDINNLTQSQSYRITSDMVGMVMSMAYQDERITDWAPIEAKLYQLHEGEPHRDDLDERTLATNRYAREMTDAIIMHLKACFQSLENFKVFAKFWKEDRRKLGSVTSDALSKKMNSIDSRREAATMAEMTSFIMACMAAGLDDKVAKCMLNYIKSPLPDGSYPYLGSLGSGMYTAYHMQVYRMLEQFFKDGKIISAGTNDSALGAKAIEGMRTPHAYTLLAVQEKHDGDITLYYVKLRNTWGRVGREYYADQDDQMRAREMEHRGNFRLELGDFVNAMHGVAVSEVPQVELVLREEAESSLRRRPS